MPRATVKMIIVRMATQYCLVVPRSELIVLVPFLVLMRCLEAGDERDHEVDQLDTDERCDKPADSVDPQVAPEDPGHGRRPILHAAQRQWNQRDDDDRVEYHR